MKQYETLPLKKAEAKGYTVITHDYNPNSEKDMELLARAIADMEGTTFCVTENYGKFAIARMRAEVKGL